MQHVETVNANVKNPMEWSSGYCWIGHVSVARQLPDGGMYGVNCLIYLDNKQLGSRSHPDLMLRVEKHIAKFFNEAAAGIEKWTWKRNQALAGFITLARIKKDGNRWLSVNELTGAEFYFNSQASALEFAQSDLLSSVKEIDQTFKRLGH